MILKDKDDKLIRIYFLICENFKELQYYCERFSNNKKPGFTNEEIMTIYLYVMQHERHTKIKHIHRFATEYLRGWFPKLGSCQAFNNRLNRLTGVFNRLVKILLTGIISGDCILEHGVLDSMPIITCPGKRSGKAVDDLFSTAVSHIRQPIESIFNWLIEKIDIQRARKARPTKGLMIHAFCRLAAVLITFKI
jgi:hypothetical protein